MIFFSAPVLASDSAEKGPIAWQHWSDDLFARAKAENKFVILDLEAVWCHWCHVMADTTYKDPKVVELINLRYIPVRVDQDANPDISTRYEDYGWPATVVFAPDGTELVKRRGYIPPPGMAALLQAVIDDPTPGPSAAPTADIATAQSFLNDEQKSDLLKEHLELYDKENGGWGNVNKLIDAANFEYAMREAAKGSAEEEKMALQTLDQALFLEDKVWGGFFQYSDEKNWKSPHYEKIMTIQAQYLKNYAQAYARYGKKEYLDAARGVAKFVKRFWSSPDGAFYTSQDADVSAEYRGKDFYAKDDAARLAGPAPRIDRHIYSRENGWMASALAVLYDVTGEEEYLNRARASVLWIAQNRILPGGGYRHDETDRAGPYLGDTLAMTQAYISLYASTGERGWLGKAKVAADFIEKNFKDPNSGYFTSEPSKDAVGVFAKPVRNVEENATLARAANLLFHYTGNEAYKEISLHAMKYLASPDLHKSRRFLMSTLLADYELTRDPLHIVIVGGKSDPDAAALHSTALKYPVLYRRVEWWDRAEGPLPHADVEYPELERAAAFSCSGNACSTPFFKAEAFKAGLDKLTR